MALQDTMGPGVGPNGTYRNTTSSRQTLYWVLGAIALLALIIIFSSRHNSYNSPNDVRTPTSETRGAGPDGTTTPAHTDGTGNYNR